MELIQEKTQQVPNQDGFTNEQSNAVKNLMYKKIEENNIKEIKRIIQLFDYKIQEEISTENQKWNALHYCCYFDKDEVLEILISIGYSQDLKLDFLRIVLNLQTQEGLTPIMIAILSKSIKCIQLIFKYGGIDLTIKDTQNRTIYEILEKMDDQKVKELVNEYLVENNFCENIEFSKIQLENSLPRFVELQNNQQVLQNQNKILSIENQTEFEKILLNGERNQCVICLSNTGYLKYTICCGHPMHTQCNKNSVQILGQEQFIDQQDILDGEDNNQQNQKKNRCPMCKRQNFYLINEVMYPQRAFHLE